MIIFKPHLRLSTLAQFLPHPTTIVEAGAFTGNDTVKIAQQWPQATVHAFEPVPELYAQLCANTRTVANIVCHQVALSSTDGYAPLHVMHKKNKQGIPSQAGSLHRPENIEIEHASMQYAGTVQVRTSTLDSWSAVHNIAHIDLLWLDLQGHELAVLQHAPRMLPATDFIYTEVNFTPRYYGQPTYQELKAWLENHNFSQVARDFGEPCGQRFGNVLFARNDLL